jgi:hypothetical protein
MLALTRRRTRDIEEVASMGDRLEDDDELGRELQRQYGLVPGRKFDLFEGDILNEIFEAILRKINA